MACGMLSTIVTEVSSFDMWPLLMCYLTHGLFDKYFSTYMWSSYRICPVSTSVIKTFCNWALWPDADADGQMARWPDVICQMTRCHLPDDQMSSTRWLMFWQKIFGLCEIVWRCINMSTKSNSHQRLASVKILQQYMLYHQLYRYWDYRFEKSQFWCIVYLSQIVDNVCHFCAICWLTHLISNIDSSQPLSVSQSMDSHNIYTQWDNLVWNMDTVRRKYCLRCVKNMDTLIETIW